MSCEELLKLINKREEEIIFIDGKGLIIGSNNRLWDKFPFSEVIKGFEEAKETGTGVFEIEEGGKIFEFKINKVTENTFIVLKKDATCERKIKQIKNEIISTVSHEVKTPLTVVKGNLEYLYSYTDQNRENRKILEEALEKVREIEAIIKGIGKLFLKKGIYKKVNLKSSVESVIESYRSKIKEKGIELELELEPVFADCEKTLFEQLVRNLIDNAVKFTQKGKVRISLKEEENQKILTVEDTGVGIPEEIKHCVFEKYVKSPHSKGMGIGLSIVREIAKFHNWQVELNSQEGKGTTVRVKIFS